jgi:hypothetical protein
VFVALLKAVVVERSPVGDLALDVFLDPVEKALRDRLCSPLRQVRSKSEERRGRTERINFAGKQCTNSS